ncbi:MAG: AbrB/MazE/SpoVT family DNA-binding domain-containing protein [Clostridia bacterium]|nr:AbrB/MazE/SpoVT family DNA-binding domain-containing protein [Clostridia bacterium]
MKFVSRKVDELGRIVLPIDFRNTLGLSDKSSVTLFLENGSIVVRPTETVCKVCGSLENVNTDVCVCASCIKKIKEL